MFWNEKSIIYIIQTLLRMNFTHSLLKYKLFFKMFKYFVFPAGDHTAWMAKDVEKSRESSLCLRLGVRL